MIVFSRILYEFCGRIGSHCDVFVVYIAGRDCMDSRQPCLRLSLPVYRSGCYLIPPLAGRLFHSG